MCAEVPLCKSYKNFLKPIKNVSEGIVWFSSVSQFGVPIFNTEHLFMYRIISFKTVFLQSVSGFKNKESSVRHCIKMYLKTLCVCT